MNNNKQFQHFNESIRAKIASGYLRRIQKKYESLNIMQVVRAMIAMYFKGNTAELVSPSESMEYFDPNVFQYCFPSANDERKFIERLMMIYSQEIINYRVIDVTTGCGTKQIVDLTADDSNYNNNNKNQLENSIECRAPTFISPDYSCGVILNNYEELYDHYLRTHGAFITNEVNERCISKQDPELNTIKLKWKGGDNYHNGNKVILFKNTLSQHSLTAAQEHVTSVHYEFEISEINTKRTGFCQSWKGDPGYVSSSIRQGGYGFIVEDYGDDETYFVHSNNCRFYGGIETKFVDSLVRHEKCSFHIEQIPMRTKARFWHAQKQRKSNNKSRKALNVEPGHTALPIEKKASVWIGLISDTEYKDTESTHWQTRLDFIPGKQNAHITFWDKAATKGHCLFLLEIYITIYNICTYFAPKIK